MSIPNFRRSPKSSGPNNPPPSQPGFANYNGIDIDLRGIDPGFGHPAGVTVDAEADEVSPQGRTQPTTSPSPQQPQTQETKTAATAPATAPATPNPTRSRGAASQPTASSHRPQAFKRSDLLPSGVFSGPTAASKIIFCFIAGLFVARPLAIIHATSTDSGLSALVANGAWALITPLAISIWMLAEPTITAASDQSQRHRWVSISVLFSLLMQVIAAVFCVEQLFAPVAASFVLSVAIATQTQRVWAAAVLLLTLQNAIVYWAIATLEAAS